MKTEQLRAFLLEKGDEFIMLGLQYVVTGVDETHIYYCSIYSDVRSRIDRGAFGINSRERIMLVCKQTPPNNTELDKPATIYDNKSAMGVADEFRA